MVSVVYTLPEDGGTLGWLVQNSRQLSLTKSSPAIVGSIKMHNTRKKIAFFTCKSNVNALNVHESSNQQQI